jgi:hypothetical protein
MSVIRAFYLIPVASAVTDSCGRPGEEVAHRALRGT